MSTRSRSGVYGIINPVAGSNDADLLSRTLRKACRNAGRDCEIHLTTGDDDFAELIDAAWS